MTEDSDSGSDRKLKGTDTVSITSFLQDLSYNEVHLFELGFYSGFVAIRPGARQTPNEETKETLKWPVNKWYWKIGYVLGYLVKVFVVGGVGFSQADVFEAARTLF